MSTLPSLHSATTDSKSNTEKKLMARRTSIPWLGLLAIVLALSFTQTASAQTGSSISSTSGPVSWDFGPVVAGTVTNVGIQDTCPPGMCDNHDLTIVLPAPAATFYQTNTVRVTIKYTWTSTVPTDMDVFAISPNAADAGPGSPDATSTDPGDEDLTLSDPAHALWHVRSVAATWTLPTTADAVVP